MGFLKFILWLLVFAVLAGGVSFYVTQNVMNGNKTVTEEKGVLIKIGDIKDGLVTNIDGFHYVKIGIILKVREDAYPKVEGKAANPIDIKATDTIIHTLRSHKADWYLGNNHDQIKEDLKKELNKAFGKPIILEVYITNFVMQ